MRVRTIFNSYVISKGFQIEVVPHEKERRVIGTMLFDPFIPVYISPLR